MRVEQRRTWKNHTKNQACQPLRIYYPTTLADLVGIVGEAERTGCTVRAVGSAHAWSDAALTTGFLVNTRALNRVLDVEADLLRPGHAGAHLVHTEAGIRIRELNDYLDREGLALSNMGGYDGQTVAGVISTSTHGSGMRFGPLSDFVRAIELVATGGRRYRIEPTARLVDAGRYRARHADVQLVQDDAWFRAVAVSLGCMGIISAVTLEVEPKYWLTEVRKLSTWSQVKADLRARKVLEENRHYEVYLNPYRVDGDNCCLVTTRNPAPEPVGRPRDKTSRNVLTELASPLPIVHFLLDRLFDRHPRITPKLIDEGLKGLEDDEYTNVSYKVLNIGAANLIPAYSEEIAVPLDAEESHLKAIDRIIEIAEARGRVGQAYHTSPIALRFVKRSDAFLSMMHGRDTMMIELIMMTNTEGGMELLATYEDALYPFGGRPHWGQVNTLTGSHDLLRRLYPALDDWLRVRQELDPGGLFNSPFTKRVGLSIPRAVEP